MPPTFEVDRLWPDPAAGLALDDAFSDFSPGAPAAHRPWVALNMVTSIDGRAQLEGRAEGIGSRADRRLMQLYRAAFDAVASGAGTLRADDFYSRLPDDLTERRRGAGRQPQPLAVLVGGATTIPTDRRWFSYIDQPRVLVVGAASPHAREPAVPGVETWVAPTPTPEPAWWLSRLDSADVASILVEGGPSLNAALLAAGAVDEILWTIGARVVGAEALPMIAPVDGFVTRDCRLASVHRSGDELFLRYRMGSIGP